MSDVAKTPREELECKKKYLYEYSMFWECNDGSKCQILEEDVCENLNEQQATNDYLEESNSRLQIQLGKTLRLVDKLKEENEQLRKEVESSESISNATSNYNAFLESKITTLEKENEQLQKKLMIVSAHLLSDECNLTESQIKNIIKEMENV